jgi:hypothetical protein
MQGLPARLDDLVVGLRKSRLQQSDRGERASAQRHHKDAQHIQAVRHVVQPKLVLPSQPCNF